MSKWNEYEYDDLVAVLSDYSKDVHGYRLRMNGESRENIIKALDGIDAYMEEMHSTFAGREQLRAQHWIIEETDPELAKHAKFLAEEREREMEKL